MDSKEFTSFIGLRDITIAWCNRQVNMSLKKVLEMYRDDVLVDEKSFLVRGDLLLQVSEFVVDFVNLRDKLFPEAVHLFPTVGGEQYYPSKFTKRMKKLLLDAGTADNPTHPKQLTKEQYKALIESRFSIQRYEYQVTLAVSLCAYLGMRPSEVAALTKEDLDFGNRLIYLQDTKSQVPQVLPILSFLMEPLEKFTMHLPEKAPLFINTLDLQWERRDVTEAISTWVKARGISGVTSRKLRASLGAMLSRKGISPALLAKILRHKDPATAMRYYNQREIEEARLFLENLERKNSLEASNSTFNQEYNIIYQTLENEE